MVVLSSIEEAKLLEDYSKIAWKMVHQFSSGKGSSIFSKEDLYQECMLCLVKHMKKCETMQELRNIHPMNLINAMTRFVLKNQVVRLDHNRTNQVKQILSQCAKKARLDEIDSDAVLAVTPSTTDEVIERIAYEQFLEKRKLRALERTVLRKRGEGYRVNEIARQTGKSHQVIAYALKSAKHKYDNFVA